MEHKPAPEFDESDLINLELLVHRLWRNPWPLIAGSVLGLLVAFLITRAQPPIYEATAQAIITDSGPGGQAATTGQLLYLEQNTQTYVDWLSQDWMRMAVSQRVGGLIDQGQVTIGATTNSHIVHITIADPSPDRAKAIANAFVDLLVQKSQDVQVALYQGAQAGLDEQLVETEKQIINTQSKLDQAQTEAVSAQASELQEKIQGAVSTVDRMQSQLAELKSQEALQPGQPAATTQAASSLSKMEADLTTQESLLDAYRAQYVQLITTGKPVETTADMQTLQQSLSQYQEAYMSLLNERQAIRLSQFENIPHAVGLSAAVASSEPVRPILPLNLLGGGLGGLMLATILVLLTGSRPAASAVAQPARPPSN